ncbi:MULTISPECIES: hypothetical protein [Lactobacillus]|uniref:hypothetical protein n=1 Tax=Lactobacillus TaxID=1578 RepID=UPI00164FFEF6|nr:MULTISPECIES: hypothetical protein [Lactobacillus]MBC6343160.1 hypothetical protein [Lactobacillus kimbladii]MBI0034036.1 hypothetical protein [Lactobacillus sp. M0396]
MKKKLKHILGIIYVFMLIAASIGLIIIDRHDVWAMLRECLSLVVILFIIYIVVTSGDDDGDNDSKTYNFFDIIDILLLGIAAVFMCLYFLYKKSFIFSGIAVVCVIIWSISTFLSIVIGEYKAIKKNNKHK